MPEHIGYNAFSYPLGLKPGAATSASTPGSNGLLSSSSASSVATSPPGQAINKSAGGVPLYTAMFHGDVTGIVSQTYSGVPHYDSSSDALRRGSDAIPDTPIYTDDSSRHEADEDKRRRNTAASARFRIKKKQREQAMEQTAKELQDKVQQLEAKIMQLEMENKWLKNLVVEKNSVKSVIDIMGKDGSTNNADEK